jgi:hypothetical protein
MIGYRESEKITMCNDVNPNIIVPFPIYECTGYYDKNRPSWKQMEKLAINVTPGPLKRVGFKVAAGLAADETDTEEDDDE